MVLLYNTLILPYLNYCNIAWARSGNNKLHSLIVTQKRAIRVCTYSHPRAHTAPLFAQLNTLTLSDINKLHTGIFMYKYSINLLPSTFSCYFSYVQDLHSYSTRSCHNLLVPYTRTTYSMNTRRFYGPRLWNAIDEEIQVNRQWTALKPPSKESLSPSM